MGTFPGYGDKAKSSIATAEPSRPVICIATDARQIRAADWFHGERGSAVCDGSALFTDGEATDTFVE